MFCWLIPLLSKMQMYMVVTLSEFVCDMYIINYFKCDAWETVIILIGLVVGKKIDSHWWVLWYHFYMYFQPGHWDLTKAVHRPTFTKMICFTCTCMHLDTTPMWVSGTVEFILWSESPIIMDQRPPTICPHDTSKAFAQNILCACILYSHLRTNVWLYMYFFTEMRIT